MQYTKLGRAGVKVSRLALGTMNFGWHTDEATSFGIMDAALEAGVNFFDTANIYSGGVSEEILGRWLAQDAARRGQVVLTTKMFIPTAEWPNFGGLSAVNIRRAVEDSLRRLQVEHIDLLQFHHVDRDTPYEEIWQATERLVTDGKLTYAGTSNFAGWQIAAATESARHRNFLGPVSEQSVYNLMERTVELEVLPAAQHYGLGFLPWSPLAGGLLAGSTRSLGTTAGEGRGGDDSSLLGHAARAARVEQTRHALEEYAALAADLGVSPTALGLAWLLAQPAVTAPVIGPRTLDHFTGSLPALDVTLDADTLVKLDTLFPGPGGTAPEAYSW